jgi:hypothetical protein
VLENCLQFIWLAAAWCIWLELNDIIFKGKILNISEVVDRIKRLSWSWFICREGGNKNFVFSNWWIDPLTYLQSI